MPRLPITRSNQHYYHLTGRANNREHFHLPTKDVWEIMIRRLHLLQIEFDLRILCFVLMNNHFHLLLMTPNEPIDRVMYFFMKDVTRDIQRKTGRINKIFGGRYKGCLILDERYLFNAYKYVCRNPIAAQISTRAEDYSFSTLFYQFRNAPLTTKIETLDSSINVVPWINSDFINEDAERVKWALSRSVFQLKKK